MTASAYILSVLGLVRRNARFFLIASLAGLGLRLLFVFRFPGIVDDSRLYANIALNWLQHGVYGITNSGKIVPTLSRLPGYPAFLAAVFAIFGANNFRAVLLIQVLFDLGTCVLIADMARRMFSDRAARAAFLLAALCPFLANYAAAALTESLEIFFTALALNLALRVLYRLSDPTGSGSNSGASTWLGCGLSIGASILLRPDGGILLITIAAFLFYILLRRVLESRRKEFSSAAWQGVAQLFFLAALLAFGALAPLIPWTVRNLHTLHHFQPLAPRYANDSDEPLMPGFNRWTKTWIAEYVSVEEIYWNVPGDSINLDQLPSRAFDSPQQREETAQLFAEYNQDHDVTPELDARFASLATERIRDSPVRYYIWLPALRITDMWLRPRTELLPSDPRWWEFNDAAPWLAASIVFGLVNLFYVGAAFFGFLRSQHVLGMGSLFLFVALRSLFLGTLENPEPRYTLECYPAVIVVAAALFTHKTNRIHRKPA
ncbi:MAG: glycosyltransferase family 39 protein [Candidatus Sulfotelmatobacter sp.]